MFASLPSLSLPLALHNSSDFTDVAAAAVVALIVVLELLLFALLYVGGTLAWMDVFRKAGYPGWAAFVSFYNSWVLVKIGGRPESNFWLSSALTRASTGPSCR